RAPSLAEPVEPEPPACHCHKTQSAWLSSYLTISQDSRPAARKMHHRKWLRIVQGIFPGVIRQESTAHWQTPK
ncbi:MAG: hypothetical protein QF577_09370, partial [Phycisphaerae bacterium]|nr:hypothetical protein [Phycisphaerae bacterium]